MLKISKIIITFILIMIFIGINEHWIHSHDERGLLENKLAVPLLITGFFPLLDNNLNFDNIEIKLPYGYRKVNEYSAITIIGSPSKIYRELDNRFDFVDQLGSSMVWVDKNNDKLIFINEVQRGGIRYLFMNTKN
ncbi:MAG: hypothetical protein LBB89_13045 [Treponema sp.]|nr:hypothetical protein [Treponema sp.]